MSVAAGGKIALEDAVADARAFRSMFEGAWAQWEIAGSVRRRCAWVGDIEHVVVPAVRPARVPVGLFGQPAGDGADANLMLERLDALEAAGTVRKAIYPDGSTRWGPRYRGVVWRGRRHDVFMATAGNFGAILAIRTGPSAFSQHLVTRIRLRGLRQGGKDEAGNDRSGEVWDERTGNAVAVPDERAYFAACGVPYYEPWCRDDPAILRA